MSEKTEHPGRAVIESLGKRLWLFAVLVFIGDGLLWLFTGELPPFFARLAWCGGMAVILGLMCIWILSPNDLDGCP